MITMIKLFALFFFIAIFTSTSSGNQCPPNTYQCQPNFSYQPVTKADECTIEYGCVPNQCIAGGETTSCDQCCPAYSNCKPFLNVMGHPVKVQCNKCSEGEIVSSPNDCCKGYKAEVVIRKRAGPEKYVCRRPKPSGSYYCDTFCRKRGDTCSILYFDSNNKPYFTCITSSSSTCN